MNRTENDELLRPRTTFQDGRLHDVSIDGEPERTDLEPGVELGGASQLRDFQASEPGLAASSVGPHLRARPPLAPPESPVEEGIAADDSDRILRGIPGSGYAGVQHLAGQVAEQKAEAAIATERGAHFLGDDLDDTIEPH